MESRDNWARPLPPLPPPPPAFDISPGPRETRANAPAGVGAGGVTAAAPQAPSMSGVRWGALLGMPFKPCLLGEKSQRKTCIYNMNFPPLLPLS